MLVSTKLTKVGESEDVRGLSTSNVPHTKYEYLGFSKSSSLRYFYWRKILSFILSRSTDLECVNINGKRGIIYYYI